MVEGENTFLDGKFEVGRTKYSPTRDIRMEEKTNYLMSGEGSKMFMGDLAARLRWPIGVNADLETEESSIMCAVVRLQKFE